MQRFNWIEWMLRAMAATAEAFVIYLGYLILGQLLRLPVMNLTLLLVLMTLSIVISFSVSKRDDDRRSTNWVVFSGVLISIAISIILCFQMGSAGFDAMKALIVFVVMIFAWNRFVRYSFGSVSHIYTLKDFKSHVFILIIINLLVFLFGVLKSTSAEVARYTTIYMVIGLYMLFIMKTEKYLKKNDRKSFFSFDFFAALSIFAMTFILSMPRVAGFILNSFKYIIGLIQQLFSKLLTWILLPIGYFMSWLFAKLQPVIEGFVNRFVQAAREISDDKKGLTSEYVKFDPRIIDWASHIIAILFIAIVIIIIIYAIINAINKYAGSKSNESFTEDRAFVLDFGIGKLSGMMAKTKDKLAQSIHQITFALTANNREKLRNEYRIFLQKISNYKIIGNESATAQVISDSLALAYPKIEVTINAITQTYEEVRYGVKNPEDNELKQFKEGIREVLKVLV